MKIGVRETGRLSEALQAEWDTYPDMVRMVLGQDRDCQIFDMQAGQLPVASK